MPGFNNNVFNKNLKMAIVSNILKHIDASLHKLLQQHDISTINKENTITTMLYEDYIIPNLEIKNFYPTIQTPENQINYQYQGVADIKFSNIKHPNMYFIIECKRLDGKSKLNNEYIKEGMCRFTIVPKYLSPYNINFMIGYIITDIEIKKITDDINKKLKKFPNTNTIHNLHKCALLPISAFYNEIYYSMHNIKNKTMSENEIIGLIHIFSNNNNIV